MNPFDTHEILNQPAPFSGVNLFACDPALQDALIREGGAAAAGTLSALGEQFGRADHQELARLANLHGPTLVNFDRHGRRIDEIEFHPAWHQLMAVMVGAGAHSSAWEQPGPGAQVARAALYILAGQLENGVQCPLTMTYASVPALRQAHNLPQIAARWLPKILSREYDPRSLPVEQKRGALIGMGMTEKQGGSDVRSNTTRAEAVPAAQGRQLFGDEAEGLYRIVGHKWFFSVPQSDAHLILAQTGDEGGAGLSCFFLPRYLPDGSRNQVRLQRLKDKLGNRSNASSEVEFTGAYGWLIGKPGRGIPTILEMGSHTRLDCVLGSTGIMRAALTQALHHARQRSAFGKPLAEQPLMQNVLADLALESEAATAFALRLARCFDDGADPEQALLARVLIPAGKYWICRRGPGFGFEAMEVMGGNGYVEDGALARLYRELPVNSIWEGSGNVMCLDLLRVFGKGPAPRDALARELALAGQGDAVFAAYAAALLADLDAGAGDEYDARKLAERIVLAVQAALLLRHAPPFVSSAFVASRLEQGVGGAYGRLPAGSDCPAILARALVIP
ncbi:isovaleryl-CoA dehydrogenase [Janthinobacterium agaricidamnosum]|uniref:Acyl-CoA dehydrogenase, N-terminal domain protein n=1 Tax=Janthinobacterium agaricidamnosum NBRC 102515 = DSM 9628 TaxID=1349767 RepID=W0V5L8_9BURK|nr:isovaleryl-CoA dehydrogenase [Janthinobacterium agaricidamnosum]CDG82895.1 acyl-CoA dehydrogenase, N-terminal domain protein [Janthinobacterium agaricidamnosum NBRC 102515 = DSM 9628]